MDYVENAEKVVAHELEQYCDGCKGLFFFMEAMEGDCSHQHPNYCPLCGKENISG